MTRDRRFGKGLSHLLRERRRDRARIKLGLEGLETRITPTVKVWTGAVDAFWSNPGNWADNAAPQGGEDLQFPVGASNLTNQNDLTAGTTFASIDVQAAGYDLSGNAVSLTGGIQADYTVSSSAIGLDVGLGSGAVSVAPGGSLQLSGAVGGTAGLDLVGGGTLELSGPTSNTYTGPTSAEDGSLLLGKAGAIAVPGDLFIGTGTGTGHVIEAAPDQIADASNVTVGASGTLDLNNQNDAITSLTMVGSTVQTGVGTLTLLGGLTTNSSPSTATITGQIGLPAGSHTLYIADPAVPHLDLDLQAAISGAGDLTKDGAGLLRLSGTNSYTGTTSILAGSVELDSNTALGDTGAGTTVFPAAELHLAGGVTVAEPLSVGGTGAAGGAALLSDSGPNALTGTLTLNGSQTAVGVAPGASLDIQGAVMGGLGANLLKNGAGALTLSGAAANGFGNLSVQQGGVFLNKSGVPAVSGNLVVGDGVDPAHVTELNSYQINLNGAVTVNAGASFDLNGHDDQITGLSIDDGSVSTGAGLLSIVGDVQLHQSAAGSVSLLGQISLDGSSPRNIQLAAGASAPVEIRANIGGGAPEIDVNDGAQGIAFSGVNLFDSALVVQTGTLLARSNQALGTTNGSTTVANGASLVLDGGIDLGSETLDLQGAGASGAGALVATNGASRSGGYVRVHAATTLGAGPGATLDMAGQIDDLGGGYALTIAANPSGTVGLSGVSGFSGAVTVNSGTLAVGSNSALGGTAGGTTVEPGATLSLASGLVLSEPITASGAGANGAGALHLASGSATLTAPVSLSADAAINVDIFSNLTLDGGVNGTAANSLIKDGAGALVLNGSSNALQATVSSGELQVDGTLSAPVQLSPGALLTGFGTTGPVSSAGATVNPGTPGNPGTLATGNLMLDPGTLLQFGVNGPVAGSGAGHYSSLAVSGAVNLAGSGLSVQLDPSYTPSRGDVLVLIANDGTDPISGQFANLPDASVITLGGQSQFRLSYSGGDGNDVSLTFLQATTTALNASPSPAVFTQDVTLTATVSAASGTPTGLVTFTEGATILGTVAVDPSGVATLVVSNLAAGSHSFDASYSGDTADQPSTGSGSVQVNQANTATTVVASPSPSVFGQAVTITATVAPSSLATGVPDGTVSIYDGATLLGTTTLDGSGVAALTTSTLAAGSHAFTAVYNGTSDYATSTSPIDSLTVQPADTGLALSVAPDPSVAGQPITATASVNVVAPGAGLPSGTVSFFDGATLIGTSAVDGSGVAAVTLAPSAGSHSITAVYNGASDFNGSTSPVDTITVGQATTQTTLNVSSASTVYGEPLTVTLTTTVDAPSTASPSGTMQIYDGAIPIGPATIDASGQLVVTFTTLSVGTHTLQGVYQGDADQVGSNSTTFQVVVSQASSSVSLATTSAAPTYGDSVTITATVAIAAPGTGTPTGTVTFYDGAQTLAAVPVDVSGQAAFTTTALVAGSHAITAVYNGDANVAASAAATPQVESVAPAVLTVSADSLSREYGEANPTLTYTFSGFVNGENLATSDVIGAPDLSTSADPMSPVAGSPYAITPSAGTLASSNYGFQFAAGSLTVIAASSTTTASSSTSGAVFGESFLITAQVVADAPSVAIPTGTVTFSEGATVLAVVPLDSSGSASFAPTLSVGSHGITATYSGDANIAAGPAFTLTQTVQQAGTAVALTAPSSGVTGETIHLAAVASAAAPGSGVPSGTVSFFDGATLLGTATLDNTGTATLDVSALSGGVHAISAVYSGDADFTGSTSPASDVTINPASTALALTTSGASQIGDPVTFTASLSVLAPGAGNPTGSVSFYEGSTLIGSAPVAAGVATITTSSLAAGSNPITAIYSGDSDFLTSTGFTTQDVGLMPGSVTLGASLSSTVFGQGVTLTATAPSETGTITFRDGLTVLGTAPISGGMATLTTSSLAVGQHDIVADYSGDSTYAATTSAPSTVTVAAASTFATLMSSTGSTNFGEAVTLTATVAPIAPGSGVPVGVVTFFDGPTMIGSAMLDGTGTATLSVVSLGVGTHAIGASYIGSASFSASSATAIVQAVAADPTTASASADSATVFGQAATLSVMIASGVGSGTPTGTVTFREGSTALGAAILANGSASISLASLPVGTHSIVVDYSGDATHAASTSAAVDQVVNQAGTAVTLSSSASEVPSGGAVTLLAHVSAIAPGSGVPTGTITFRDGSTVLGTAPVVGGAASFVASGLSVGSHALTASYAGSTGFLPATSAMTNQVVTPSVATVTLFATPSPSGNGQAVTLTALVVSDSAGATPTGSVSFYDGSTLLGSAPIMGQTARLTVAFSGIGSVHTLRAVYSGDASHSGSSSEPLAQAIQRADTRATVEIVRTGRGRRKLVGRVKVVSPGGGVPSGDVVFTLDGRPARRVSLVNGEAAIRLPQNADLRQHTIGMKYLGDANDAPSVAQPRWVARLLSALGVKHHNG